MVITMARLLLMFPPTLTLVPVAVFRALIMMGGGYNRTLGPEGGAAQCSQVKHTRGGALLLTATLICCACALQTSDATEPGNISQRLYLVTCLMTFVRCNTHLIFFLLAVCFSISSHYTARMGVLSWSALAVLLTGHNYVR